MKVTVIVSILICLLNTTAGLTCYKCNDFDYYVTNYGIMSCDQWNETTSCHRSSKFCLTYEFLDDDKCDAEVCIEKDCDWFNVCESVGTHRMEHPLTREKVEVSCCQGDLCNRQSENINSPSSHNKLPNQNYLFYALFSSFFSSVFVTFRI